MTSGEKKLEGWALILGASSGFGAATARALAREGLDIAGVHMDRRKNMHFVEAVIGEIEATGRRALYFNMNAADPDKRAEALDRFREEAGDGKVKVLLHSLAFGTLLPYFEESPDKCVSKSQMEMTLDVMAHTLVYWTQELLWRGLFADDARVFAMTSEGSTRVFPHYGAVSAAKAALEAHVRQLAFELAPRNVRVNAIQAGVTNTPALRAIPGHELMLEVGEKRNPSRRLTTPEDVGEAIATLSLPGCGWITGDVIKVDGGEHFVP